MSRLLKHLENPNTKSHYDVLQVASSSSISDVAKAYREKSLLLHEDRLGKLDENTRERAKSGFIRISEAYRVLINKYKRAEYDRELLENSFSCKGEQPVNVGDVSRMNLYDRFFTSTTNSLLCAKSPPVEVDIVVDGYIVFNGDDHYSFTFKKKECCSSCQGSGTSNTKVNLCLSCNGSGMCMRRVSQKGLTNEEDETGTRIQFSQQCTNCASKGVLFEALPGPRVMCTHCDGSGYHVNDVTKEISIPKGISIFERTKFVLRGEGNVLPKRSAGDVHVYVSVNWDPAIMVKGINLFTVMNISLLDALCGFSYHRNWYGTPLTVSTAPEDDKQTTLVVQSGDMITIDNFGLPGKKGTDEQDKLGTLTIQFRVQLPTHMSQEDREIAKILFTSEKFSEASPKFTKPEQENMEAEQDEQRVSKKRKNKSI